MSGVGRSWDVFTTYTAVLEGLPAQFALALRRIGFAVPGNLAAFLDDFEFTETQLDQTVSEADTTTVYLLTLREIPSVVESGSLLLYSPFLLRLFTLPPLLRLELSHQLLLSKTRCPCPVHACRWRVKTLRCLMRCGHRSRKNEIEGR